MAGSAGRAFACVIAFGCLGLAACGAGDAPDPAAGAAISERPHLAMNDLKRGFYVSNVAASCAEASNASLLLLRRNASSTSHAVCEFDRIEQVKDATFVITQTCTDDSAAFGGATNTIAMTETFELISETAFRVVWPDSEPVEYVHCPQPDLPEPWRNNDISALVE